MPESDALDGATQKGRAVPAIETVQGQTGGGTTPGGAPGSPDSPSRIGRFEIRRLLGEGAFARVYLGFDAELEREVAIKVSKVENLTAEFRETFLRENRIAAIINHPNVCPIYEVGTDGGRPYIVMRVVASTLAGLLKRMPTPMPTRNAVAITRKLAMGLVAAHAQKIIHRDLKPANVLYDEVNREVLIADFGLARFADQASDASQGVAKGTPAYMAPEQARGQTDLIGPLSDVYALGVILYEMLAGRVPFRGSVWEVMRDHCETVPLPPSSIRPGSDAQLDLLCLKALAKSPADRYPSAKAFAAALADYLRAVEQAEQRGAVPAEPKVEQKTAAPAEPKSDVWRTVGKSPAQPPTAAASSEPEFEVVDSPPPSGAHKSPPQRAASSSAIQTPSKVEVISDEEEGEIKRHPKPKRGRPKPKTASPKLALWIGSGVVLAAVVGILVWVGVSRSGKKANSPQTVDTGKPPESPEKQGSNPSEQEQAEIQRDWEAYKLAGRTNSADFIKARGPARRQAWKRAADGNNAPAMVMYARCCELGVGEQKDMARVIELYRRAADLGEPIAQNNLGVLYANGFVGGQQDFVRAKEWYEKAAAQNNPHAQNNLGDLYESGHIGDGPNYVRAKEWFEKAAAQGHAGAQFSLAYLYANGRLGEPDYVRAKEWYEKAAVQGHAAAQNNLGVLYETGRVGNERDYARAKQWFEKAAAQDNREAQFNLGLLYENGRGVEVNRLEAMGWYLKAAAKGHTGAIKALERLKDQ